MAQLIKLRDYVSRYEWNMYRYPSQFIRLKQENWKKLLEIWEEEQETPTYREEPAAEKEMFFSKLKSLFRRNEDRIEDGIHGQSSKSLPATRQDLKYHFLDKLYPLQLKWATSTVSDVSFISQKFHRDIHLKYFLQRFPDTYFVLYYPIFTIKKAPIDGEIILISPVGIEIIYLFSDSMTERISVDEGRKWTSHFKGEATNIINPFIALKRTEQIINSILHQKEIDFPVQKTVLAPRIPIYFQHEPYRSRIIGSQQYQCWFEEKRALASPLKNRQLRAGEAILMYCETNAVKRPEWEEDDSGQFQL